jgi:hypothetical protein
LLENINETDLLNDCPYAACPQAQQLIAFMRENPLFLGRMRNFGFS